MLKQKFEEFKELVEQLDSKIKGFHVLEIEDLGNGFRIHFMKEDEN